MKSKILRVFLALVVALPMFTSVFAISYTNLMSRLDVIQQDVDKILDEYNSEMGEYTTFIDSLSQESKDTIDALANGKVLDETMPERLDALKAELELSSESDAKEVLDIIEETEQAFETVIEENKDVVNEVKAGYSNLTTDEIKQVVEKVAGIAKDLGMEADVTDTYNAIMNALNNSHDIALDINEKLEEIIASNVKTFESALTKDLIIEVLDGIKAKDRDAVIDTLIEAAKNVPGKDALKEDLKEVKALAKELKSTLLELKNVDEQDLLMFSNAQKKDVSNKLKAIEKDYIEFAKVVLDDYSKDYMKVAINLAYNETVDQMIEYANEVLDYWAEYKDTIKSLSAKDIVDRLALPKELAKKAGLLVALGFVDTTDYNKDYVTNNFKSQIEDMGKFLAEEFVSYLDYIAESMEDEVNKTYQTGTNAAETQNNLRKITGARFGTLTNLKALKTRVDSELLANRPDEKEDVQKLANYVYGLYNDNILYSVSATIVKENDKPVATRKYETNPMDTYILTDYFIVADDFTAELGIPEANKSVISYANTVSGKVKTGSTFAITLSDTAQGLLTFAVLGDTYADGRIDARDYMAIKNEIMKGNELSKIALLAADTYRDKLVDARDYMVIKNEIMKGNAISL